jgi:hypothetical protein
MSEGGATAAQAVGTELLNSDVPIASSAWFQPPTLVYTNTFIMTCMAYKHTHAEALTRPKHK